MTEANGNKAHVTEIDKAMETAREKQAEEVLHEQVRMERLHVSTMALSGLLASGMNRSVKDVVKQAIGHADELLKQVTK